MSNIIGLNKRYPTPPLLFQCQHKVHRAWSGLHHRGGEGHPGGAAEHPAVAVHWGAGEDRADEKSGLPEG